MLTPRQETAIKYPVATRHQASSEVYAATLETRFVSFITALIVMKGERPEWRVSVLLHDRVRDCQIPWTSASQAVQKRAGRIVDELLHGVGTGKTEQRVSAGLLITSRRLDEIEETLLGTSLYIGFSETADRTLIDL